MKINKRLVLAAVGENRTVKLLDSSPTQPGSVVSVGVGAHSSNGYPLAIHADAPTFGKMVSSDTPYLVGADLNHDGYVDAYGEPSTPTSLRWPISR